jgi:hypothetical protein
MSEPRRLKELSKALPFELGQALDGAPGDPSETEQQALALRLGATLGIALSAPSAAASLSAASSASSVAQVGGQLSTVAGVAAKSGGSLLVWLGGGLVLGTALSATAIFSAELLHPQPNRVASSASSAVRVPRAATPVASALAVPTEPELDAGVHSAPSVPEPKPRASSREQAPEPPAAQAGSELGLLRRAQQVLRTDPLGALDLCAAHLTQFPAGVMVQEREMIAIEALLRLGRAQEANARASTFVRLFPGSAHRPRLQQLLSTQ